MTDVKTSLRQTALAARQRAFDSRADTDVILRATAHLLARIGPAHGLTVAGYMPMRSEIDPIPAMTALHRQGARICVPVIAGKALPLEFREWTPEAPLVDGPFGARIPASGDWLTPETLIVPMLAFDATCNRLGYGGGFYDRTLARLKAKGPVRALGFAFAAQALPDVAAGPTDVALDGIVTEDGIVAP
ncbi:5-formyltetrahydrofolate cyclo-ligase [Roseicyclus mahoneyensis]|jgi:5-formyltetrahydrofolate cyclo-ligase|uniref:5-formyltetrahydrofolate cyclo-ligase n=1 Tax=Roseicyclus mahoneyensis TaxID=164332 RepID=A0A316H0N5_9RHOB|nr:5-formyltetrahydrofolate cyclo-ligase [Roseicyclus mahoneyensis]PWK60960.1 5-formyltetrahydrofolate cyclo-ligase [Roseicyclus mahoneyensis]